MLPFFLRKKKWELKRLVVGKVRVICPDLLFFCLFRNDKDMLGSSVLVLLIQNSLSLLLKAGQVECWLMVTSWNTNGKHLTSDLNWNQRCSISYSLSRVRIPLSLRPSGSPLKHHRSVAGSKATFFMPCLTLNRGTAIFLCARFHSSAIVLYQMKKEICPLGNKSLSSLGMFHFLDILPYVWRAVLIKSSNRGRKN